MPERSLTAFQTSALPSVTTSSVVLFVVVVVAVIVSFGEATIEDTVTWALR